MRCVWVGGGGAPRWLLFAPLFKNVERGGTNVYYRNIEWPQTSLPNSDVSEPHITGSHAIYAPWVVLVVLTA